MLLSSQQIITDIHFLLKLAEYFSYISRYLLNLETYFKLHRMNFIPFLLYILGSIQLVMFLWRISERIYVSIFFFNIRVRWCIDFKYFKFLSYSVTILWISFFAVKKSSDSKFLNCCGFCKKIIRDTILTFLHWQIRNFKSFWSSWRLNSSTAYFIGSKTFEMFLSFSKSYWNKIFKICGWILINLTWYSTVFWNQFSYSILSSDLLLHTFSLLYYSIH